MALFAGGLVTDIDNWLLGSTLGVVRMAPSFYMLPFFNAGVLGGATRVAVMMFVSMGFWPAPVDLIGQIASTDYLAALARELLIGMVLACLLSWPFWVFHAVGSFVDNQRGATISSSIDPVNGEDTSELANFFNWFAAAIFLYAGGLNVFVQAVQASYVLCDPLQSCHFAMRPVLAMLSELMIRMVVVSAPVIAVMLLCEITLGLLSRFAPQLNAFSISLTIKSLIAIFVLLMYFGTFFPAEILRLSIQPQLLPSWFSATP